MSASFHEVPCIHSTRSGPIISAMHYPLLYGTGKSQLRSCVLASHSWVQLFVRLLGITQDLSVPAPIARYQTPHLIQNCRENSAPIPQFLSFQHARHRRGGGATSGTRAPSPVYWYMYYYTQSIQAATKELLSYYLPHGRKLRWRLLASGAAP